jgi:Tfp pilus assembly protein PilV
MIVHGAGKEGNRELAVGSREDHLVAGSFPCSRLPTPFLSPCELRGASNAAGRRRGAVLIVVMMALAVATLLAGLLMKGALAAQRQQRIAEWRHQAEWLAESGIERARYQLRLSAAYAGEDWEIPEGELGTGATGLVAIEVQPSPSEPARRLVRVRSEYLRDGKRTVRFTKEIEMQIGNSAEAKR